jgi:ATP-dependent RNA helicase SUPV3L1/SUV3
MTGAASRVTAILGPTNTGKTHYAIERMLAHRTGVIGLPLRLLAREVYDRIVELRGPSVVALVTGEERIVPPRAAWWVCTVEAMPVDIGADFLAVDEIQLCGDPDRGHIFTDRLLNARGLSETLFLGSDTIRARIASLVPGARFLRRERLSRLSYTGQRKLSRMPPRSAIVGFSVEDVYAIAELIRRQRGGAAVVMGALSPRTRNAQVALYQNGDVDHLVATDAIGMGLNLDIAHVAFSGLVKFDGRRHRRLGANELAQIAGRAGRYTADGTFGVTGEASPLEPDVVEAIESSRFAPLRRLQWRNDRLEFVSIAGLIASIEARSEHPDLVRVREADDLATLRALDATPDLRDAVSSAADVRLLWDVCRIPDFRKVSMSEHVNLCRRLFDFLQSGNGVPTDWLARQVDRIDRTDGDIDALSRRLAFIRTWTYVAQRRGWVDDSAHWRDETRAVEDRLSDALHLRLTQRFVDRRTSVLMRRLKQRETLVATVSENGEVTIDDQFVGRLEGFRFRLDPGADPEQVPTLRAAAIAALAPVFSLHSDKFYNAPDTEFDATEQGGLMWGEHAVGKLVAGPDSLSPQVQPFVDEDAPAEVAEKVRRRLGHFVDRRIAALFEPLITLRDDETLEGLARGIAFRMVEALGVLPRAEIAGDIRSLEQEHRAALRKHGVRFGQFTVFMPALLKPAPTRLRLVLWSLSEGLEEFPEAPPPGLVTVPALPAAPRGYYPRAGYRLAGERAIRIDMLERLADIVRPLDARNGFEATPEMLSISGLTLTQFATLMQGLGYRATPGTRAKRKTGAPEPQAAAEAPSEVSETFADAPETATAATDESEGEGGHTADAPAPETETEVEAEASDPTAPGVPSASEPIAGAPEAEGPEAPDVGPAAKAHGPTAPDIPAASEPVDGAPEAEGPQDPDAGPASEVEEYFVFTRAPRRRPEREQGTGRGAKAPPGEKPAQGEKAFRGRGGRPRDGGQPRQKPEGKPPSERPRPPKPERTVDPDSPFAALMALKLKK